MKTKIFFLSMLLLLTTFSYSQSDDEITIGSYKIKIVQVEGERYGYEIYEKDQLLVQQKTRPYINRNKGFLVKENAKKLAIYHTTVITEEDKSLLYDLSHAKGLGVTYEDLQID